MNIHFGEQDIPDRFYSEDSKRPFEKCVSCQDDLDDKTYFVEKAYRKYPHEDKHEVIFEYAICQDCAELKNNELSEESKAAIIEYFEDHISTERLIKDLDSSVDKCMVSESNLSDCEEYVIYGQFHGDKMQIGMFPYALSGKVLDEIAGLLSEKTLGEIDDFIGEHFTGPPQFKKLLKDKKWVFV